MKKLVLDAWAILAYLQSEESAASHIKACLAAIEGEGHRIYVSIINLGEVYYRIGKRKGEEAAQETIEELREFPLIVLPADSATVWKAARLKIYYTLSYADAFAAQATLDHDAVLLTGDPELQALEGIIKIEKLSRQR